jgi:hypothetical protein
LTRSRAELGTLSNGRATARVRIVGLTKWTRGKRALLFFYHHAHNTVVRNAHDLIDEFWRKNPHKKRTPAKPKPKTSPQKARKSAARDEGSDAGSTSVKKRGRKSVGKIGSDDMDVDEVVERPPKKSKKNAVNAKKPLSETSDAEERIVQNMDRYMDKSNWETLVKNVDTVERVGDVLMVFFTLYVHSYFPKLMSLNKF